MKTKYIYLSEAKDILGCRSRNTVRKILADFDVKPHRLRDRRTSPWLVSAADVEKIRRERLAA